MKRLGHFPTESSGHHAEYSPYFIPHGPDTVAKFAVPIDAYMRTIGGSLDEFARMKEISRHKQVVKKGPPPHRTLEYGSTIIHSVTTGKPSVVYGNMPNHGTISNIVPTAIVEAPTLVDRSGLKFAHVGELPPQVVGYIQPHITQHELFIRAAVEGRRDHVYQAAMFDPLTAATLRPDQIVSLCDELIAAHGKLLPNLNAKKVLVPSADVKVKRTDPNKLRRQWDAYRQAVTDGIVVNWQVIGPFMTDKPGTISVDMMTPLEKDFLARANGSVDLKAACKDGRRPLKWFKTQAQKFDAQVDCDKVFGHYEFCLVYGYATIDSPRETQALLKMGSDDGLKVWLNGQLVHRVESMRGYAMASDQAKVTLRAGKNHLLVKLSQLAGGWGFGVSVVR
jgi:hypothetical protein